MPETEQDTENTNAGRVLARQRWGTQLIDNALGVIEARSFDVTPDHVARLRAIIEMTTP